MKEIRKGDTTQKVKETDTDTVSKKRRHFIKIGEDISSGIEHDQQMQVLAASEKNHSLIGGEKTSSETISRETDKKKDTSENVKRFTTLEQLGRLAFKSCEKVAPLDVLLLTDHEVKNRGGYVKTLEGDLPLKQGDYLARGIDKEQWLIKQNHFIGYNPILEGIPDKEGFIRYTPPAVKRGFAQINEIFKLQIPGQDSLDGKAGDYMILENARAWIVDREIFKKTYQVSEEIYQPDLPKKGD